MRDDFELFDEIEARAGGAKRAAALLGVSYNGCWAAYKSGRREIPEYVVASVEAHLALSDRAFTAIVKRRIPDMPVRGVGRPSQASSGAG